MRFILFVAIGVVLTSYGFSSGASLPNSLGYVLGWVGAAVTVGAAYLQYRASIPYEHLFTEADWRTDDGGFVILIPLDRHNKAKGAGVDVLERTSDGFAEVVCDNQVQSDGAILVSASTRFTGKVVVR